MRPLKLTPCILILAALVGNASPCGANTRDHYYDVRDQFSSEQVIGPVTLHVVGMNPFTDTVGKWDTSSQNIPSTDPSSILGSIPGVKPLTDDLKRVSEFAGEAVQNAQEAASPSQVQATAKILGEVLFSKSPKELAKTLNSSPKHAAEALQHAILPANSKLLAVQSSPGTLEALIRNKPQLVANALIEAKPVLAPRAATSHPLVTSSSSAPSCTDALVSADLRLCVRKLADDSEALHEKLMPIRDEFRELVRIADAILAANRSVTNSTQLEAMTADVRNCIIDVEATCSLAADRKNELTKVRLNDLVRSITFAQDDYRRVSREYDRLAVAVAGLSDEEGGTRFTKQLNVIKPILDRYRSIFSRLDAYSQKHLVPLTVAGVGSGDVLMTSGFEVRKIETCTGLANHGATKTDVLNYLPSPAIQLGIDSDPKTDTNTAENGPADKSANATEDKPAGKASPAPASDSEKTDDSASPQTRHDDVTVICEPPLFLSAGLAADTLPGTTYTSAAANTAGLPKPAAGATPIPSTILSSSSGIGPTVVQLANYALTVDDSGGGLALSAGLGTNATFNSKARADALLGLSFAFARTLVLTGGVSFGPTTQLAPGYAVRGPVVPGATIPTTSSFRTGAFFGVTFVTSGAGPKAAASPSPKPSTKPSGKTEEPS